uniref:No apical meristem-associated C-terminal domain-containing protein n=1 Tax=Oryza barthii TaxID=65489 RepID=A0A0D3GZR0_9ORYZ
MDPDRAYYSFLEDSEVAHPFGQSRSQVDLHHRQDDFPYAHAEFPAFSTQQPTDGASNGGLRSASRAGTRHRVQANPVGEDDGRGRMYYTRDEDLRLAVCDSPKWNAHISLLGRGPRKIAAEFDVNAAPIEEHEEQPRPMGIKRAKKAKQAGISLEVKDLVKSLVDAKARQDEETSAMKEFQQKLSEEKTQTANILLLAAQEKTKAKLIEQQTKLLEKFTEMIAVDTSCMEPWAREAHIRACTHMSDQLWGKGPSMQ